MDSAQNVRAMAVDYDGRGTLLIGPPGVGKAGLMAAMLAVQGAHR
jgi:DNA replication protein DnaC